MVLQIHCPPDSMNRHGADTHLQSQTTGAPLGCILRLLQRSGNDLPDFLLSRPTRTSRPLSILKSINASLLKSLALMNHRGTGGSQLLGYLAMGHPTGRAQENICPKGQLLGNVMTTKPTFQHSLLLRFQLDTKMGFSHAPYHIVLKSICHVISVT